MSELIKNRRINYKRKLTDDSFQASETNLSNLKEAIERGQIIIDGLKDNRGWELLSKTYDEKVKHLDSLLLEFHKKDDKELNYILAERKLSIQFRDTVIDIEKTINRLKSEYEAEKSKYDERRSRARNQSDSGF